MTREALLRPLEDPRTVHQRHHYRARFWRLALARSACSGSPCCSC